ncbi:MAG: competence/damage-inducible protein A [Fimbriimonadaceae bacterium]
MRAETVTVGTEILLGQTIDSNAARLGTVFADCGIDHFHRQAVGDNVGRIAEAVRLGLARAETVVTIGGLGPTEDDATREGVSEATGRPLIEHPETLERLQEAFRTRGIRWVPSQARQAQVPQGAETIPNPNGTAPGLWLPLADGKTVVCLPGPPREFNPMVEGWLRQRLGSMGHAPLVSQTLRVVGMGESLVEEKLRDLLDGPMATVATYAKTAEVHVRVSAKERANVEAVAKTVRDRLGESVYGSGETTLPETVVNRLRDRGESLAVAESCTGGLLGGAVTSVAGSSNVFLGGFLTYSNEMKQQLLGVDSATLADFGAVSEECALEMAAGARRVASTDWAVSVTGIAGPDGGTPEKPVGLVWLGIDGPPGARSARALLHGDRSAIRQRAVVRALDLLRIALG